MGGNSACKGTQRKRPCLKHCKILQPMRLKNGLHVTQYIFFKDPLKDNVNTEAKDQFYIYFHLYMKILQTEHLIVYILYLFI
jgi:hypothetical protein